MPEARRTGPEILSALFGDLVPVPWHVPFAKCRRTRCWLTWRTVTVRRLALLLQDMVLAASDAEHHEHGYRARSRRG